MNRIIYLLGFTIFCVTIGQTNGQDGCVPRMVENVTMSPDGILQWEVSPNETCVIGHFIINVQVPSGLELDTLITISPRVSVSHLDACLRLLFTVTAVTIEYFTSIAHHFFASIPMPLDEDLSINYINYVQIDNYISLNWELTDISNTICADFYRITIEGGNREPINRTSPTKSIIIRDLIPCENYRFNVSAVHLARPEFDGPIISLAYTDPAQIIDPPTLVNVTYGSTFFNSYWTFDYSSNVCNATALYVDGSPYFNNTYPVQESLGSNIRVNVTYLNPDSLYLFRVRAENTAGLSSPIHVAIQTLPANSGN